MTYRRIVLFLTLVAAPGVRMIAAEQASATSGTSAASDSLAVMVEAVPPTQSKPLVATSTPSSGSVAVGSIALQPTPGGVPLFVSDQPKDSLETPTAQAPALENPTLTKQVDQAVGVALLPARIETETMRFDNVAAAEVVLRFSREYRASIVFSGDGSIPVTGWTTKGKSVETMLRAIFHENMWTVTTTATSVLVTQRPSLTFRKITETELNPPLLSL